MAVAALAAAQRQGLATCYTDVASVKKLPLREARELGCDLAYRARPPAGRPGATGPLPPARTCSRAALGAVPAPETAAPS